MRLLLTLASLCFFLNNCQSNNNTREALVKKALTAIVKKDLQTVLSIVDTAYCFDMYGKVAFLHKLDFASNLIGACNENGTSEKLVLIKNDYLNTFEYVVDFCGKDRRGNKLSIKFSFFNHKPLQKISIIDFTFYNDLKSTQPNTPVPDN